MVTIQYNDIGNVWFELLKKLYFAGEEVSPRGQKCYEITDVKVVLGNALNNVLVHPVRKPSYRFMVAEWLWIFFGHTDVKTISQYSKVIGNFSDDGETFEGSYGAPVVAQWDVVRDTLARDPMSRQAVIYIFGYRGPKQDWRVSKDVPCTLSWQFLLRNGRLDMIATMRSSDIWLGLVYDVFNFSQHLNIMAGELGVEVGQLSLNLGSSHLYERDRENAKRVLESRTELGFVRSPSLIGQPRAWLDEVLQDPRADIVMDPSILQVGNMNEWARYEGVLRSKTQEEALTWLRG